jgi:hypothetical protein
MAGRSIRALKQEDFRGRKEVAITAKSAGNSSGLPSALSEWCLWKPFATFHRRKPRNQQKAARKHGNGKGFLATTVCPSALPFLIL